MTTLTSYHSHTCVLGIAVLFKHTGSVLLATCVHIVTTHIYVHIECVMLCVALPRLLVQSCLERLLTESAGTLVNCSWLGA